MLLPKVGLVPTRMVGPKMASEILLGRSRITWCNICRGIMLLVQMVTMAKTDFRLSESEPDSHMERMLCKLARTTNRYKLATFRLNCNQRIRLNSNKLPRRITKPLPIRTNRISHQMCEYLT